MSGEHWRSIACAAQQLLDDLPGLVLEISRAIRERVPDYTKVTDEQLTTAVLRNVADILAAMRDRRPLTSTELGDFALTVEERARNGVPVDQYLLGVTTAEALIWEQLWQRVEGSAPDSCRLEAFALRFNNVNAITRVTASAHRRVELASARADQERRALALRALLRGGSTAEDAREHLARLGLAADRSYYVVRARARGGLDPDRVPQALLEGPATPPYAAFVLWGEDTVGLVRDHPGQARGLVAGLAGPVPVSQLQIAHQQATTAFETAWALGLEGAHELQTLGIRAAVQASPEVGRALRERYLDPLLASGGLGEELLTTTRAYLDVGSRREAAAARLHVHQNTVAYRLSRFCELTGADLSDLATLADLHWLFTDLDLRPSP